MWRRPDQEALSPIPPIAPILPTLPILPILPILLFSYLTCHGAAWIPLNQHSYFLPSRHHDLPFDVCSITSKPYTPD